MRASLTALLVLSLSFTLAAEPTPAGDGLAWKLPEISDPVVQDWANRLYLATQRLAHHQISLLHPWAEDSSLLLLTESKSGEHHIRPNTGTAAGLAFLYRFGPYDDAVVGLSREELLQSKLLPMMRYLTTTHVTGSRPTSDGNKWGDAWQSAHWAEALGMAGWWIGRDLPPDLAEAVRKVVAHEADRFVSLKPPHQLREDTKAEENAWNATVLSVAVLLMPEDTRRPAWEKTFQKWALSSFLRPADEKSPTIVDGRPLSEQFTGANIYDDFTLENHHIVHPDYMTTWSLTLGCAMEFMLTGRQPPEAIMHNAAGIYENLKWFNLPDGGFVYPSGQDWALFRQMDWLCANLTMGVFGRDAEAWALLDRSLEVLEKMQARSTSGAIYLPEENYFPSASSDKMSQLARGWLKLHFATSVAGVRPERQGVRKLDSAKIILNRTRSAVHTVCWGNKVMAQCMPMQKDRLVSPHDRSGVGHIMLKGENKPLDVSLADARIDNSDDGFTAVLVVDHGKGAVRAHLQFRSNADGTWSMREKLVALADITTAEIATGLIGVLNNPRWIYERGERRVDLGEERSVVRSMSGKVLQGNAVRAVSIDSVLRVASKHPLSVRYQSATQNERSRVTDELSLNCRSGEQHWKAGQVISEWQATVRCEPRE